jgi:hypothetical protein
MERFMSNDVIRLAYEKARAALKEQDATLSNVRNRANSLLAAATLSTSLASLAAAPEESAAS